MTGHYPVAHDDDRSQLTIGGRAGIRHEVFPDDALLAFLVGAYRYFHHDGDTPGADIGLHGDVVTLIGAAKRHCHVG